MLPKDEIILLSFVNMKLRDKYSSLQEFCEAYEITQQEIKDKLKKIEYEYVPEINQFR